jgi:hypothetical protein
MPTTGQKSDSSYKKLLELSATNSNRFTFNEPFTSPLSIDPQQIWLEQYLIPNTAPSSTSGQSIGVVQKFNDLILNVVPGTINSFYHSELKNCISPNYGDGISYNIQLKDNNGNIIPYSLQDWVVDRDAGVLTFYGTITNGVPSGDNLPPANMPPKISFYKYIGAKGNSVLYLSSDEISGTSGTANSYNFNASITSYTSNAIYIFRPVLQNTGPLYININGLGSKQVMKINGSAMLPLDPGDIDTSLNYILIYDKFDDVFQISSGSGGANSTNTAGTMVVSLTAPGTINYEALGFSEIGSVQFYRKTGNDYTLINADIDIQHIAKTITVNTITSVDGILSIVGRGNITNSGTAGSSAPYFEDLADVSFTNLQIGDGVYWNGSIWGNNKKLLYTTGSTSIDWENSKLYDTSGNAFIDWENRKQYYSNGNLAFDFNTYKIYDNSNIGSIDWLNRYLYTTSNEVSVAWNLGLLLDNSNNHSLDWLNRRLVDSAGVHYPIEWNLYKLNDNTGVESVNWTTRELINSSSNIIYDWQNHVINYSNGNLAFDFTTHWIYDTNNLVSIDWNAHRLYYNGSNICLDWATGEFYSAGGSLFLDSNNFFVYGVTGISAKFYERFLLDTSSVNSIGWAARELYDDAGSIAFRYNTTHRDLIDASVNISIDYQNRFLVDNTDTNSIDWQNRYLLDMDGQIALNFHGINYLNFSKSVSLGLAKTIAFTPGANQMAGVSTLVAGTVTISNTALISTINSIFLQLRNPSGTLGHLTYSINSGVGFTVTSTLDDGVTTQTLDTSTFIYFIMEVN